MPSKYLLGLTNPVSPEREAEYNDWYTNTHLPEVTALPGFKGARRFRATASQPAPGAVPQYSYLALYELDDVDEALDALATASHLVLSTSVAVDMSVFAVEEIADDVKDAH